MGGRREDEEKPRRGAAGRCEDGAGASLGIRPTGDEGQRVGSETGKAKATEVSVLEKPFECFVSDWFVGS